MIIKGDKAKTITNYQYQRLETKAGILEQYHIMNRYGLNDGYDCDRMVAAVELLPSMHGETLESVFQTLISLEFKGLMSFNPTIKPMPLNSDQAH